jgi:hypothetical protein
MGYVVSREIMKAFGCTNAGITKDGIVCDKFGNPWQKRSKDLWFFLPLIILPIIAIIAGIAIWAYRGQ